MTTCIEGDLKISFSNVWTVRRFDGSEHGFSSMKAVDLIAESSNRIVFIEIKDPEDPSIPAARRRNLADTYTSEEKDFDLKYKYRDSFLYEWACGRVHKPIYYWILIAIEDFGGGQLLQRSDALRRKLPVAAESPKNWKERIAEDCLVFNMRSWNDKLAGCQVERISTRNQSKGLVRTS